MNPSADKTKTRARGEKEDQQQHIRYHADSMSDQTYIKKKSLKFFHFLKFNHKKVSKHTMTIIFLQLSFI